MNCLGGNKHLVHMYNMFQMYNICYIYMERGLKDIYDIYIKILTILIFMQQDCGQFKGFFLCEFLSFQNVQLKMYYFYNQKNTPKSICISNPIAITPVPKELTMCRASHPSQGQSWNRFGNVCTAQQGTEKRAELPKEPIRDNTKHKAFMEFLETATSPREPYYKWDVQRI